NFLMAGTDNTKAKLLRGVVQDNVDIVQGVRTKRAIKRKLSLRYWFSVGIGMAGLVYLAIPSQVVSTAKTPPTEAVGTVSARNIAQTPESEAPLDSPRPLDKKAVPLAIKRIIIDPGHGGESGAISESGVMEKEITLDVALRLRRLMEKEPYEILLTRQTDQLVPLDKRVAFANENKGDLFVSIHVNSMEPKSIRALETYYVGPTDDPATLKLASIENKDSGYSLSDYKQILEKIYVDARHDESRTLAKTIQAQLHHSLKRVNPRLENRGVKTAPFVVLIGTQMPAILVEISVLSNDEEVKLLTKEHYRENIALALLQGIKNYARNFNAP
ncbi:MAG TPA: N-acetylmuramoyl-L-alanine amidase, partial [Candidatus Binatia bacterium]|nr:N-acetylmuramoyl-L-alanine amidase [Candidatus Binatia bacterium]